jgi:hypothetical protein
MDLKRFSPEAFEALRGDPHAARRLADELQDAVAAEVGAAAGERFRAIVTALNALGHRLTLYGEQSDDGIKHVHVRDYTNPEQCALRLAMDITISAGFKDVWFEGGWGELPREEGRAEQAAADRPRD